MLDALRPLMLVGTRGGGSFDLPPPLADVVPVGGDAASRLLRAAGAAALHEWAGHSPSPAAADVEPAEPDRLPPCPPAAASVLEEVLQANEPALLHEWLDLAAAANVRAPHAAVPHLLDRARRDKSLRGKVAAACDARGEWLATLNPAWNFAAAKPEDLDAAWQTGTRDERVAALAERRKQDAAAGLAMVRSTWDQDAAADRAAFVAALAEGLSMADEPFLEDCLDDRSKQVREAAAELLARLPASRLVGRMTQRAFGFVRLVPVGDIEVALPSTFENDWARDGLQAKPPRKVGERQWWLRQIIARVPPWVWLDRSGRAATSVLASIRSEDATAVVTGLGEAASRHPHGEFAVALAKHPASREHLNEAAFAAIPPERREEAVPELDSIAASICLKAWIPLTPATSRRAIEAAQRFRSMTPQLILALAPEDLKAAASTVHDRQGYYEGSSYYSPHRLRGLIATRRQIHKAFDHPAR